MKMALTFWTTTSTMKGMLPASRRLPPEILSHILLFNVQATAYNPSGFYRKYFPHQVCREWRSIALSTPGLWVTITLDSRDFERVRGDPSGLIQYLQRSRNLPLDISISFDDRWIL